MAHRYRNPPEKSATRAAIKTPKSRAGRKSTLLPEQVDLILKWLAEGLTESQIADRAANEVVAFRVTNSMVNWYRTTRNIDVDKLRTERELEALRTGLAVRANRIKALERLARQLEDDIDLRKRMWLQRAKALPIGSGKYEKIFEDEFVSELVSQLRGVYNDIAMEVGGRAKKIEHAGADGGPITFDLEEWKKTRTTRLEEVLNGEAGNNDSG